MTASRTRWMLFGACAALVVAAMAWVTDRVVTLERSRDAAEAVTRRQHEVRLALWRMDSAMSAALSRETGHRWISIPSTGRLTRSNTGEAYAFDDERIRVRFLAANGEFRFMSAREPAQPGDDAIRAALEKLGPAGLAARVRRDAPVVRSWLTLANSLPPGNLPTEAQWEAAANGETIASNIGDRQQRAKSAGQNAYQSQQLAAPPQQTEQTLVLRDRPEPVPLLVPVWLSDGSRRSLAFVRELFGSDTLQGLVLDWDRVSESLLAETADLELAGTLRPVEESKVATDETGLVLATAPAAFDASMPAAGDAPWTPTRTGLAVAWLAVLAGLGAAGVTLRATVADGERRARFASSVTHELRTPLTTFRLYSEMLADGMVRDPAQQKEYLATLKTESARLAALVENVLAFARVEEGRLPRTRERIAIAPLLERALPPLRRRCDDGGARLVVRNDAPEATVDVNPDAVGQILGNLVDNACKYAASASDRTVEVTVERRPGAVAIAVRDHGPGIAAADVAAAFTPFERGNRPPGDLIPGIGLGLALSRGLARDLGGDLVYEPPGDGPGARFVLTLPAA